MKSEGILSLKLGDAKLIDSFYNLIHIIDLEEYVKTTDQIQNALPDFKMFKNLQPTLNIIEFKLQQLLSKIDLLLQKQRPRQRRGLINGLGSTLHGRLRRRKNQ